MHILVVLLIMQRELCTPLPKVGMTRGGVRVGTLAPREHLTRGGMRFWQTPAALPAKQLPHGRQGGLPKYRHGDQPKDNCYKFFTGSKDRDVSRTCRLAGEQHTGLQGRVRQEREDILKRPNVFKQGMAGQLEDMSVKNQPLCSEVFLSLVHDSFSKLNTRGNFS